MSDHATAQAIRETQKENKEHFDSLRDHLGKLTDGLAVLTTSLARVEERHSSHDQGMKRMGRELDDHEDRIRILEKLQWKIIGMSSLVAAGVPVILWFITEVGSK